MLLHLTPRSEAALRKSLSAAQVSSGVESEKRGQSFEESGMIIGMPREIKKEEYRVAMTPEGISELKKDGHAILVETGAGEGSGFSDD